MTLSYDFIGCLPDVQERDINSELDHSQLRHTECSIRVSPIRLM